MFSTSRELVRIVYPDPEHVAERLTLYVADRYGDASREWVESTRLARPDTPPAVITDELRTPSAQVARIDGAISGTPFFIALQGHDKRSILRTIALVLSVAIPIGFTAYVDHVSKTVGVNWLGVLGAVVVLSLVMATAVISSRRYGGSVFTDDRSSCLTGVCTLVPPWPACERGATAGTRGRDERP